MRLYGNRETRTFRMPSCSSAPTCGFCPIRLSANSTAATKRSPSPATRRSYKVAAAARSTSASGGSRTSITESEGARVLAPAPLPLASPTSHPLGSAGSGARPLQATPPQHQADDSSPASPSRLAKSRCASSTRCSGLSWRASASSCFTVRDIRESPWDQASR
jgi:hypothetical protein